MVDGKWKIFALTFVSLSSPFWSRLINKIKKKKPQCEQVSI